MHHSLALMHHSSSAAQLRRIFPAVPLPRFAFGASLRAPVSVGVFLLGVPWIPSSRSPQGVFCLPQPVKSFSEFLGNCRHEKCIFNERMVHWFFMHVLYNIYADEWEKLVDVFTRPDVKKIDELCKYLTAKGIDAGTICTFIHKMEDDRPIGIEVSYSNEMKAFAGDFIIYKRK
jgi:hypothetical protein